MATGPTFAERLRELREASGLSQYALAKRSGVTKQAISLLERGDNEPSWVSVRKLARGLGVSVSEFDTGDLPGVPVSEVDDEPEPAAPPPPAPARRCGKK
ncbi:MAG: helix-turn-helix domain-containing protein [Gemmataceae bacterium]|nr:helix-turn-helix domain-containing protein [Gemmataceae bacterium]